MPPFSIFSSRVAGICATGFLALALCGVPAHARKSARVIIDAQASEEFLKIMEDASDRNPITYAMVEGNFYGGLARNTTLEQRPFIDIAKDICERLKQRHMYPAANPLNAEILIRVSWGSTEVDDNADIIEVDDGEGGTIDFEVESASQRLSMAKTARLIGFRGFSKPHQFDDSGRQEQRALLLDERYFIVVQAFDFQALIHEKESKALWVTRYSMGSAGVNFDEAYLALSKAAQPFFGQNFEKAMKSKVTIGKGEVYMGELEVLGVEGTDGGE